ncbi:hypothetical protein X759_34180 [Mesorhizobium sp. LSHC420B00]|nr:hypothetical protein X759_34180 [Mesorhizobium sp. LSHC420B00]
MLALVSMQEDGSPVVRVLPITHTPPSGPNDAIEIPAAVKLRLRLDGERSWVVSTESNRFAVDGRSRCRLPNCGSPSLQSKAVDQHCAPA